MHEETEFSDARTGRFGAKGKPFAVVLMALALIYDIVPTDVISDFVVFFGWSDDLVLTSLAAANLVRKFDLRLGGLLKGAAVAAVIMAVVSAAVVTYLLVRLGMYMFGG